MFLLREIVNNSFQQGMNYCRLLRNVNLTILLVFINIEHCKKQEKLSQLFMRIEIVNNNLTLIK